MLRTLTAAVALVLIGAAAYADPVAVAMYKNPQCSCCDEYAKYLRQNGFCAHTRGSVVGVSSVKIRSGCSVPLSAE